MTMRPEFATNSKLAYYNNVNSLKKHINPVRKDLSTSTWLDNFLLY
jgi:hypothetical protein